ncbi:MAG: ribosome silencing factor [Clostridia bacterium]|nr:ribosome silencing factor [Clostridia bacterium]
MPATSDGIAQDIINILKDKKAKDIISLDIHELTVIADYFVICHGNSTREARALAEEVEEKMQLKGYRLLRKEGLDLSKWVLLDYGSVIVHIFRKDEREFYGLERLWADAKAKYFQADTAQNM